MTKKELQRHYYMTKEVEQLAEKLDELRELKTSIKAQSFDGMPKATGNNSGRIENLVAKYDELESKYNSKLIMLLEEQKKIEEVIYSLDPLQRILMRYRYINHLKWEEICVKMNYSWRQVHRLHNVALGEISKKTTRV